MGRLVERILLSHESVRCLFALILITTSACHHPGPGYRTSSVAEAVLTAAEVAVCHPEMVAPRSDKDQKEMEAEADARQGKQVVPEGLLGPDTFLTVHID